MTRTTVPAEFAATDRATEKQEAFIRSLLDERVLPDKDGATGAERRQAALAKLGAGATVSSTKKQASRTIEYLLSLPRVPATPRTDSVNRALDSTLPEVPAGRYAVKGDDGVTRFYRVDRPEEGRWAGYTFVTVGAGGPHGDPDWHPVKNREARAAVLAAIATDPPAASRLYGLELGECGVCGRTLTDETSRAYGIGPVCRENTGW